MTALLVDATALAYNCLYAAHSMHRPSDGMQVGAVVQFVSRVASLMASERPTHAVFAFDAEGNFRRHLSESYKGNRPDKDFDSDQLREMQLMRYAAGLVGLRVSAKGYEADDVLATYVRIARKRKLPATVVADDKDMHQLVSAGVTILGVRGNAPRVDEAAVRERWGVPPSIVPDVQAIAGDGVDNVGGVKNLGPKRAAGLVAGKPSLLEMCATAGDAKSPFERVALAAGSLDALRTAWLVRLHDEVPGCDLVRAAVKRDAGKAVVGLLLALESRAGSARAARDLRVPVGTCRPDAKVASRAVKSKPAGRTLFG